MVLIPLYLSEGKAEGVRGDIAFAQSCLETGNFGFSGSAVTLDQNNFCGMGVTSNGMKGNFFDTPQLGIRAQVQHLKTYASQWIWRMNALIHDLSMSQEAVLNMCSGLDRKKIQMEGDGQQEPDMVQRLLQS